ncbi:MAG: 30S ribosomal protein S17 [bacterium]|nr:30S ribosomal protein S17 [bacterium]
MKDGAKRKERVGVVMSAKAAKTLVVQVERRAPHPKYGKLVRSAKKYYVHDEGGQAREGDVVRIEECRPMSRLKRWRLVSVVTRSAAGVDVGERGGADVREGRV